MEIFLSFRNSSFNTLFFKCSLLSLFAVVLAFYEVTTSIILANTKSLLQGELCIHISRKQLQILKTLHLSKFNVVFFFFSFTKDKIKFRTVNSWSCSNNRCQVWDLNPVQLSPEPKLHTLHCLTSHSPSCILWTTLCESCNGNS